MRYLRTLASASALALAVACTEKTNRDLTAPETNTPGSVQATAPVSSPYCTAKTDQQIITAIGNLYFKNQWPDPSSATGKFGQVTSALDAGNVQAAILAARNLINFITNKYEHLTQTQQDLAADDYNTLIADIWCFVGISGEVFDLNPDDPEKTFTIPGVGGVWFPPSVVLVGTMVVLTDISHLVNPLTTPLDQYSSYIDIQLIPSQTFTPGLLPIVVICPAAGSPTGLFLGHDAPGGFEVLEPVDFSDKPELVTLCGPASLRNNASQGWLAHWATRAASLLLPRTLQASMLVGGIGGSPLGFSPFGAVSTSLVGTDGLGGSATQFAPRAETSAAADGLLDGTVGTDGSTADPDWPVVTIKTLGGDADGQNPIQGVTVTFAIGASSLHDPDSQAAVCRGGTVKDTVQVQTDANGVASLPCLKFGTVAGFANLQATFDPTTVGFPGDELLQVSSNVDGATSSTLNWLVKSNAGAASKIVTYIGDSPSPSYNYGTATAEGAAVFPAPRVLVTDQFNNPVGANVGIDWSPLADANGAVLAPGTATTDAFSVATASSWTLGAGAHTLTATIAGAAEPRSTATFTASTPTGVEVFACAVGGSKTDIGWMNIPKPSGAMREITLYMSITGQSSSEFTYPANIQVRKDLRTNAIIGSGSGGVTLPGNNGSPRAITLRLSDPVTTTEVGNGNPTFWIFVDFPGLSPTRKIQVWYNSTVANNSPCSKSLVYAPGSTTSFKKGLGIKVTN